MPRCSAPGCRNMGSHTFPKDPLLRKQWEKATKKENFKASKHSRLCSDHFKQSDYIRVCLTTGLAPFHRYLKKSAVPSIFAWNNQDCNTFSDEIEASPTSTPTDVVLSLKVSEEKENKSADPTKMLRDRSVRLKNRKAYLANRRCSVPQCNMRPSNEISLYPCPNNAAVRNEWAEALQVSYQYVKSMVACTLHFMKIDFIQSNNAERVLKHNAVPSRNLPNRKKVVVPVRNRSIKKDVPSKAFERQKTMTDIVDEGNDEEIRECRACLNKLDDKKSCCYVFQAWAPPWDGMEATIAEDLAKLANVEINISDRHSKVLCAPCYQRLLDSARFAAHVRNCDKLLRMRFTAEIDMEKVWPKPIQIDKNINGAVYNNPMEVEIKQEVLSDEEYPANYADNGYVESELANLEIKIEPEEFVEPPPLNITINGTISLDPLNSENKHLINGTDLLQETSYPEVTVKQEPMSEGEQESDQVPDLPLECLLCTKSFNSVTGLKAHVIAHHSYKTVKRKSDDSVSPEKKRREKHQCGICRRNFQTSTDLMVHETCHNKHACYGCMEKFDSFELLTRHRKRCKANVKNSVQKLKTLEDVKRPLPEEKLEHLEVEIKNELSNINIKTEIEDVMSENRSEGSEVENEGCEVKNEASKVENEVNNEQSKVENKESVINHSNVKENSAENQENTVDDDYDSDKTDAESDVEDTDCGMKLRLEIHSTKSETESMVDDADMLVETLENDDST